MAENVESIVLKVEEETRKGRNGDYTVKVVKSQEKTWTVGKKDVDLVKVGQTYTFNLQKSEYNDTIYYWANLTKDQKASVSEEASSSSTKITNKDVVAYFDSLDKEAQKSMIWYLIERVKK